jgi:hypothetical protein
VLHAGRVGNAAGYYHSGDEYSRLAVSASNEKEIFYINLAALNARRDYTGYESLLAHEFQHMIHWYRDPNEETWLNEGLSELAQSVAGYRPTTSSIAAFVAAPDTQLNNWDMDASKNPAHYGGAYLLMAYFAQRFGPELSKALVAHPANGISGFEAVLETAGLGRHDGAGFEKVFADWVVANYVNQPDALGLDGIYGYRDLALGRPAVDQRYEDYPTDLRQASVGNYATDYILLQGSGSVTVDFSGQTGTALAKLRPYSGQYHWWSNRGDVMDTRLTCSFDLRNLAPGTPVEMQVAMAWEIEPAYDFGYVLASRDGHKWDILAGPRAIAEPGGAAFGAAYSGKSAGSGGEAQWFVEQFDLSAYAGSEIQLRFEYVTDDGTNGAGWFIDDLSIPALGYAADFENGDDGWVSEGWLLTDNQLAQHWLLQVLVLEDGQLSEVRRVPVDEEAKAEIEIEELGAGKTAVLAISGLAPVVTEPAEYQFQILR